MTVAQQQVQQATIRALLDWGGIDVRAKDVDGNTALHYLAGTLNMSDITLTMVRAMDGGEEVWQESKNGYGVSPCGENKITWGLCLSQYEISLHTTEYSSSTRYRDPIMRHESKLLYWLPPRNKGVT